MQAMLCSQTQFEDINSVRRRRTRKHAASQTRPQTRRHRLRRQLGQLDCAGKGVRGHSPRVLLASPESPRMDRASIDERIDQNPHQHNPGG